MVEAAYFWSVVIDESYRDPRNAAVICAACGFAALLGIVLIAALCNLFSKYTRDG